MQTLVVGCGLRPKPGAVNLDKFPLPGVDVVFDLNKIDLDRGWGFPPVKEFENETYDHIEAEDVLEHVRDMVAVFNELGRVLKIGGTIWIRGPHYKYPEALWDDPTHLRAFTLRTFAGWCKGTYDEAHYGYYFHQGKLLFEMLQQQEVNKGLEVTMKRIQ